MLALIRPDAWNCLQTYYCIVVVMESEVHKMLFRGLLVVVEMPWMSSRMHQV